MCLLLASRSHPDYELVLISNRDEFFGRRAHISSWQDDGYILCPCDLPQTIDSHRFSTWCGINKDGRIATILNLKLNQSSKRERRLQLTSRGRIPTSFLLQQRLDWNQWDSYEEFAKQFKELDNTGDFNFFYGDCKNGEYKIIDSLRQTHNVLTNNELQNNDSCMVVSNDVYRHGDEGGWVKVQLARQQLHKLIEQSVDEEHDQDTFISRCFQIASISPPRERKHDELLKNPDITRESIFVPPLKVSPELDLGTNPSMGFYGTRSQIVILVSKNHEKVTFVEKVIHNSENYVSERSPDHPAEQVKYEFDLN